MTRYRTEGRELTFGQLVGRNAFEVLATMQDLLKRLSRETGIGAPDGRSLDVAYAEEATTGDYDNLLRVSHRYAYKYLRTTLSVEEEFDAYVEEEETA